MISVLIKGRISPRGKPAQLDIADAHADQLLDEIAERFEHAPDFAVAAFVNFYLL
jgi:hypothetical protein